MLVLRLLLPLLAWQSFSARGWAWLLRQRQWQRARARALQWWMLLLLPPLLLVPGQGKVRERQREGRETRRCWQRWGAGEWLKRLQQGQQWQQQLLP